MASCFLIMNTKYSWMSETEYFSSGKSNLSFQVEEEILNLLSWYADLISLHVN